MLTALGKSLDSPYNLELVQSFQVSCNKTANRLHTHQESNTDSQILSFHTNFVILYHA